MKRQTSAYLHAVTAVLFWSTAATAFKLTLRRVDYLTMLFGASVVSLVFLGATVVLAGRAGELATFTKRQYVRSAILGLLNPFLYYLILFKAYSILTAQEALVLNYTWPVMLVLLSIPLLGQPLTLQSACALMASFAGVFVIATGGDIRGFNFTDPLGVSLALSSAVVWGIYWIYNVRDDRDETVKLFLNFLFGTFFILVAALFGGITRPDVIGFTGMAYIGIFEMGATFVLWLRGLRLSETAAQVSIFVYASPFLSLVFIGIVVGERIALSTIAGLVFIVTGILLQHFQKAPNQQLPG